MSSVQGIEMQAPTWCRRLTRSRFWLPSTCSSAKSESKCSASENFSGNKKFSKAHNSCKLFCRGVPVISRRFLDFNRRTLTKKVSEHKSRIGPPIGKNILKNKLIKTRPFPTVCSSHFWCDVLRQSPDSATWTSSVHSLSSLPSHKRSPKP